MNDFIVNNFITILMKIRANKTTTTAAYLMNDVRMLECVRFSLKSKSRLLHFDVETDVQFMIVFIDSFILRITDGLIAHQLNSLPAGSLHLLPVFVHINCRAHRGQTSAACDDMTHANTAVDQPVDHFFCLFALE